jgi:hypothetical protein
MNNWTISRRVIAGFATMLIIIALGVFALWRLNGLAQNIADLADSSLPSVLSLEENANLSRDNLIYLERIGTAASAEENAQLEQKIAANKSRVNFQKICKARIRIPRTADSLVVTNRTSMIPASLNLKGY